MRYGSRQRKVELRQNDDHKIEDKSPEQNEVCQARPAFPQDLLVSQDVFHQPCRMSGTFFGPPPSPGIEASL